MFFFCHFKEKVKKELFLFGYQGLSFILNKANEK